MSDPAPKLKRGELAESTGVNSETLRFYEKAGLLHPERGANGYRLYDPEDAKRIRLAQRAVGVGFSLNEIKQWLENDTQALENALGQIETKIGEMEKLRKSLKKRLKKL
ncbi:MerR family transcriptional regulator [Bryobacter aggregatus]|uniref:MerR family transcriptional regulator n=1 Tax=Bryobacter aggregatus TaxID=360054 RepID=UPI00068CA4C7|nr:MerR family transcriptional regulator [Bryobacter aggregatus]